MYQVYQVLDGESLDFLANKFNTTIEELKMLNGLGENVEIGSFIVVPNNNSNLYYNYTVKPGDNLYNISKMYNQELDVLYSINGIKEGDYIYPGQVIYIPKNNYTSYITKDNDTIETLISRLSISDIEFFDKFKNLYIVPEQLVLYERD